MVDLEVGYSARNVTEYERIWTARRKAYVTLPIASSVSQRARDVQRQLTKSGSHRGAGIADLLIAACAEIHQAILIHYDADFETISSVTEQATRWLVPRGMVD